MGVPTVNLKAVMFHDLQHAGLLEGAFACVSYGDAAFTLAPVEQLLEELKETHGLTVTPLIKEMEALPPGTLIALEG